MALAGGRTAVRQRSRRNVCAIRWRPLTSSLRRSPGRCRRKALSSTRSPGTTSSTGIRVTAPPRRTAARTATERLSASAAASALCSCPTSSAIDTVRITKIITQLAISPVRPETMPATIRVATSGSISRWPMRDRMRRRPAPVTELRPYSVRRCELSAALSPSWVVRSCPNHTSADTVQNNRSKAGELSGDSTGASRTLLLLLQIKGLMPSMFMRSPSSDHYLGAYLDHTARWNLEIARCIIRKARECNEQLVLPARHV